MRRPASREWKNPSVTLFAAKSDPVHLMMERAAEVALNAMQEGWSGPPFDPFALAEFLEISTVPNSEILDARTVPLGREKVQIEYNPNRPPARIHYSVAHEIAHTFFPDCAKRIRNRARREELSPHEWELEMLCNVGAAELLMPTGSLDAVRDEHVSIRDVLELRTKFEVSTESILLRLVRLTGEPYTMFTASRTDESPQYKVDYSVQSRTSKAKVQERLVLPVNSIVSTCTAIGYTAMADEVWPGIGPCHIECVGIAPYPGAAYPRVVGFIRQFSQHSSRVPSISFVTGDATEPRGSGRRILAHVVNDATPNWGAGFGRVVQSKWPEVQRHFKEAWYSSHGRRLGSVVCSELKYDFSVCQMICQRGYGPSATTRLRYTALRHCLISITEKATNEKASVHMPRIGTGEAGGSWALVSALIDEILCGAGVSVTIYDLHSRSKKSFVQTSLFDQAR